MEPEPEPLETKVADKSEFDVVYEPVQEGLVKIHPVKVNAIYTK